MWKVYLSRYINHWLFRGDKGEMLSARIHREGWWCEFIINAIFFWHNRHCERCHRWEVRYAQTHEETTRASEEAASCE
jgi:hypothetical protein